jgi:phosphoesterase RecJ-like protein
MESSLCGDSFNFLDRDRIVELREQILKGIGGYARIGIMSHVNPDGDGFCANLALQRYLQSKMIKSQIILDEAYPAQFSELAEVAEITQYDETQDFDLLIIMDCNSESRLGPRKALVRKAKRIILIDHHEQENSLIRNDYYYIDTEHVSTGVILFNAFSEDFNKLAPSDRKYVADCIYTTILNDTNNFRNLNTNAEAYEVSAILQSWGMIPQQMYSSFFDRYYPMEMKFVGATLSTLETFMNGRILYMYSTLEMAQACGMNDTESSNMTRWVQGLKGVDAIVYVREEAPNIYRASLRSLILNVNSIAVDYDGGGHKNASGCTIKGSLGDVKTELITRVNTELELLDETN